MKIKPLIFAVVLLLGLVIFPGAALAHSVMTDYQLTSGSLQIQSSFSTGEAFQGATVVVYSPQDPTKPWFKGKTDQTGKFVFHPDPSISGNWSVEIGEGGHRDQLIVPVSDRGIDLEKISYLDRNTPHRHRYLGSQLVVVAIAIVGGIGSRVFRRNLNL